MIRYRIIEADRDVFRFQSELTSIPGLRVALGLAPDTILELDYDPIDDGGGPTPHPSICPTCGQNWPI